MKGGPFEHSEALQEAQQELIRLRSRIRKLHWIAGGKGYDNMGRRELGHVRDKLDEADHWLASASQSLAAGGRRAHAEGFVFKSEEDAA